MIGIYKITNKLNGKVYIGKSKNIETRWKQHLKELVENKHHCLRLQQDWNNNSIENFYFSIEKICNEKELSNEEQYTLDLYFEKGDIYNTQLKVNKQNNPKPKSKNNLKPKRYKTIFPKGLQCTSSTIHVYRLLFYIMSKSREGHSNILDFPINQYLKDLHYNSNAMRSIIESAESEMRDITVNDIPLFDNYSVKNSGIQLTINKNIYDDMMENRNCIKLLIGYDDFSKISTCRTLIFLLFILNNSENKLKVEINDFKLIFTNDISYSDYSDLKRRIIKPIMKDLMNIGYSINLNEIRYSRNIKYVEFSNLISNSFT